MVSRWIWMIDLWHYIKVKYIQRICKPYYNGSVKVDLGDIFEALYLGGNIFREL